MYTSECPILEQLFGLCVHIHTYTGQSGDVFYYQRVDFMKNVTADGRCLTHMYSHVHYLYCWYYIAICIMCVSCTHTV